MDTFSFVLTQGKRNHKKQCFMCVGEGAGPFVCICARSGTAAFSRKVGALLPERVGHEKRKDPFDAPPILEEGFRLSPSMYSADVRVHASKQ